MGAELFDENGQTDTEDRHNAANSRFRNFASMPKKEPIAA
jgi:hypothetical protein